MTKKLSLALVAATLNASVLWADVPRVMTDIPPVHSLVSQVMQGVGTPDLLVSNGASAHSYSLRPSQAATLESADLVFWIGPELTPWLVKPIEVLANKSEALELLEAAGTVTHSFRAGETFGSPEEEEHSDSDHDKHDDEHGDGDHDEHADGHGDEEGHDDGEDKEGHAHGHAHDGLDPHAWLDPENGKVWLDLIAAKLAEADPDNAPAYLSNAEQSKSKIDALSASIAADLAPIRAKEFIVFHDAYQYFETRFGLAAAGAIASGDAAEPGPARIAAVRDLVSNVGVTCVLTEPQMRRGLVETVLEGSDVRVATVDPAGTLLDSGPALYSDLLESLASALVECMS